MFFICSADSLPVFSKKSRRNLNFHRFGNCFVGLFKILTKVVNFRLFKTPVESSCEKIAVVKKNVNRDHFVFNSANSLPVISKKSRIFHQKFPPRFVLTIQIDIDKLISFKSIWILFCFSESRKTPLHPDFELPRCPSVSE